VPNLVTQGIPISILIQEMKKNSSAVLEASVVMRIFASMRGREPGEHSDRCAGSFLTLCERFCYGVPGLCVINLTGLDTTKSSVVSHFAQVNSWWAYSYTGL
jgi:hypothetical protein